MSFYQNISPIDLARLAIQLARWDELTNDFDPKKWPKGYMCDALDLVDDAHSLLQSLKEDA